MALYDPVSISLKNGVDVVDSTNPLPVTDSNNPLSKYMPAEVDNNNGGNSYFGYVDKDGNWYIQRRSLGVQQSIRYVKGSSGFSTNWTNRDLLSYDYFSEVF